ncbi:hypothetical protein ONS95_012475 [Cadophora gregata]|uniref:uncharacterized protein n=1 Tax=Cadophora gregata TaxID=51156 RepID=UPI0026DBA8DC|nr:uncharacterized protein ONS95_012475 [Cadophora gregata]KAK0118170.1 hypothetical protein ONS95_012475 [Cadophora gregata]KAK0123242.1 hypothetical protein ONS96_010241 [Cadophora gregata f. sp. sojae]
MASHLTRASKRAEGLTTRSGTRNNVATIPGNHRQQQSNIGKKKRPRDSVDHEEDHFIAKKKARIAIEIHPRPKAQPKTRSLVINANLVVTPPQQQRAASPKQEEIATQTEAPSPPTRKHTNHHDKVVNGIKHELDRLQPNSADLKDEKRKLRSQEGTRFKSELSAYFPEYDEIIGNEPKEEHILNLDTPIIILDSAKTSKHPPRKQTTHDYPLKEFSDYLFTDLHDAQRVDFSWMDKNYKEDGGEDPLSEEYFELIHRKPERQEKAIRNTDKGRAQHEKDQVIRLLEGLQGHDWLKLMGVSGITEGKKKEYEPAREYFLKGCEAIIEKFRIWKELEKQKKLEREAAMAEAEEEGQEEEEEEEEPEEAEGEEEGYVSDGDPPDYSDVDASAARQLHEEAVARSAPSARHPEKKPKVELIPEYKTVEREFKSFYNKPHLREAALGRHRRSGRSAVAWGHPVPEVAETDFDLPEEYRDEETLKIHARRKRRDRRVSKS